MNHPSIFFSGIVLGSQGGCSPLQLIFDSMHPGHEDNLVPTINLTYILVDCEAEPEDLIKKESSL